MERERVNNELGELSRVLIKSNPPKAYAYARYASARRLVGQLKNASSTQTRAAWLVRLFSSCL
jgi:hypothetical protein